MLTAKRGTRPRAPHDQRTKWAYIFGAICPGKGKGAGLVMPYCDTPAMEAHLEEISRTVDPGAHAVLILDQAEWHTSPKLDIPDNITLLPLPPRSPELNPVENVSLSLIALQSTAGQRDSSCATTGSRTASSHPTTTSSLCVVRLGTISSINRGASHQSKNAHGHMSSEPCPLV
jgi:hypothetical protein